MPPDTEKPLYLSSVGIDSVELSTDEGEISVQLGGGLVGDEDHCEWDRLCPIGLATTSAVGGEFGVGMKYNQHLAEDDAPGDQDQ